MERNLEEEYLIRLYPSKLGYFDWLQPNSSWCIPCYELVTWFCPLFTITLLEYQELDLGFPLVERLCNSFGCAFGVVDAPFVTRKICCCGTMPHPMFMAFVSMLSWPNSPWIIESHLDLWPLQCLAFIESNLRSISYLIFYQLDFNFSVWSPPSSCCRVPDNHSLSLAPRKH